MNAPVQTDRQAWTSSRVGRFTASTIGKLMAEPRSKAAKEAGELSEGAKTLIAQKATERIKGYPIHTASNYSMRRGTLLEHAAVELLSIHWKVIDGCTYMDYGTNAGATPDGLVREPGTPTCDIKCKEDESEMLLFADQVPDGDFEALKSWNRDEAYQIAMQAKAAGTKRGYLIYFTDKLHAIGIDSDMVDKCNGIMEVVGEKLFQLTGQPHEYRLTSIEGRYGFAFIARGFDIPQEEFDRIDRVLERAEVECVNMVERFREHLAPTVEEVESQVAELIEGSDIAPPLSDEELDVITLDRLADHLRDMPWPTKVHTGQGQLTIDLMKGRLTQAVDMALGTIKKDLKKK